MVNNPSWLSLLKILQCTLKEKRKRLLPITLYFLPTLSPCLTILNFIYIYILTYFYLYIWLHRVLVVACGIQFPNKGSNPGTLGLRDESLSHWTTRGVPQFYIFIYLVFNNLTTRTCLVAHWLTIHLLFQKTQVQALVWEDSTCHGATKPPP